MIDPHALGLANILLPNGQEIWIRKASFASQASAVRDLSPVVRSMADSTATLGPGQPPAPAHPEEGEPRRWAYQPGFNLRPQPRSTEPISFAVLQQLAENYDVLGIAIEYRKNEMRGLPWVVQPKPVPGLKRDAAKARNEDLQGQVDDATAFLAKPNREDFWSVWLGEWLDDLFVIDAPTVFLRPTRDGNLYSAEVIDGATIRPIIDAYGRIPQPPDAAYGQVIYGQTWGQYTSDELLYMPYWQKARSAYGHPPTERILMAVSRALRRQSIDLNQFTEGTMPVGFYKVPETWSGTQIAELQDIFDGLLAGNDLQRSRVRFVPGGQGTGLDQLIPEPKTDVEEWLLYVTCAAVGVQPTDIGFQPRGSGLGGKGFSDAQQDAKISVSQKPMADHIKGVVDIILTRAGWPDLELVFPSLDKSEDIATRAQADDLYVRMGKTSVDELRERDDQDPIGLGNYIATGQGPVLVEDLLNPPEPVAPPVAVGPDGQPLPPPDAPPPGQGEDAQPPDDGVIAKIAGDLDAWSRKARRSLKGRGRADVPFTSDVLEPERMAKISTGLARARTAEDVRRVFELAKAGASADPFASSTSGSSSSSGTTTSPARASGSSRSSSSARRPYP